MRNKYRPLPTRQRLQELFYYNPETGTFTRRTSRGRWRAGELVGTLGTGYRGGYVSINVDYVIYRAHRLAWVYMTGTAPAAGIDHANGLRGDNRWLNLREANQSQNLANKKTARTSLTGEKGVYLAKRGKYVAKACKDGKMIHLGTFTSIPEAKAAYDAAAKILHGEFFRS